MTLAEIFDKLLETKKITLVLGKPGAESLRVSLLRKFKDYKQQMSNLGFLDPELAEFVVSLEWSVEASNGKQIARFFLRPKQRQPMEYEILAEEQAEEPSDDKKI